MNRSDARERLAELIRDAATPPKPRIATKPPRAAKERRLKAKEVRGKVKQARHKRITID
jgi:ribosome-associated protein